jgi:hypothetical protein
MSAASSSSGRSSSSTNSLSRRPIDPITRTALRYTLSPKEYELLHQYLISRAPQNVQRRTPAPKRYEKITKLDDEKAEYNVAAVRAALRVFVILFGGLKGLDLTMEKLAQWRAGGPRATVESSGKTTTKFKNTRIAASFSLLLLFHRLLHRLFLKIGHTLSEDGAEGFRTRNPTAARLLMGKCTPALAASLAGFALAISPAQQLRVTIAIYAFSKSLEFGYNHLSHKGVVWGKELGRPWWFGSWLLMPVTCGQLLHAFVFDRECFPESMGAFILKRSPEYIQMRPKGYPAGQSWPGTFDIVDGLAEISKLKWPPFVSPILFPGGKETLPNVAAVRKLSPISGPAHPGTKHTSCAFLHPQDRSCARTYLKYWIAAFPTVTKFFTMLYGGFALLAYKALLKNPAPVLNRISQRIIKMSLFITGAIGTSWGSICLFNNILPRGLLPTQRWFLGGFLGGCWAFVARSHERDNFLYSFRLSVDSFYKVGKKRGWWKGIKHGDVLLFIASLALVNYVYEVQPGAVKGSMIRQSLSVLQGQGLVDKASRKKNAKAPNNAVEETRD